jgi:hypothetical protein
VRSYQLEKDENYCGRKIALGSLTNTKKAATFLGVTAWFA